MKTGPLGAKTSAYGDFSVSDFHLRLGPQHTGTATGPRRVGPLSAGERTTDAPGCTVRRSRISVAQAQDTIADDPATPGTGCRGWTKHPCAGRCLLETLVRRLGAEDGDGHEPELVLKSPGAGTAASHCPATELLELLLSRTTRDLTDLRAAPLWDPRQASGVVNADQAFFQGRTMPVR